MKKLVFIGSLVVISSFLGCVQETPENPTPPVTPPDPVVQIEVPQFNVDSAYSYIEQQVAFGPRVPGTATHVECKEWLVEKLTAYADDVIQQSADLTAWDGNVLPSTNIIARFNPEHPTRILLCAHWDTRPIADHDPDISKQETPIAGANDGGSGVGVLVEIARLLSLHDIEIGIDIILFDSEDYGNPYIAESYCLGSQYWAKQPHVKNYDARFGILLDMVGATNSTFTKEGYSYMYAPKIVDKVWNRAQTLGYSTYFVSKQTDPITDDHKYVNEILKIPTIDIIHRTEETPHGFGPYWHTHDDDMSVIDKKVLQAVGQTVLHVIYEEQ